MEFEERETRNGEGNAKNQYLLSLTAGLSGAYLRADRWVGISIQEYRAQKASKTIQLPEGQRLAADCKLSTEYLFETET